MSTALSAEISQLSELVDEFNFPFHSEKPALNEYKRKIFHHVENGLGSILRAMLSTDLATDIENIQQEMTSADIHCLSELINEFDFPFRSEQHHLHLYKRELLNHIENGLVSKLRAGLSAELATDIENIQREMRGNK